MVIVRFAPSPTGRLHVGNARVALVNWLFAKGKGGQFLLRIDDTDRERSKAEFEAAIEEDLRWLGLAWDRKENQSARIGSYEAAADRLRAAGRLYPCYETADELEYKRKRQLAKRLPPVYDRAALSLTEADRAKLEAEGRRPHWRFKLNHEDVRWVDEVRGPSHYHGANLSDPVLIREDGTFLYTLPSVVDDIDFGVTHVVRGEDHVTNTAPQIQIFEALGAKAPGFAHLPLLTDAGGQGLSKRLGSLSLGDLRAEGIEAMALNSLLAHLGTSDAIRPETDLAALAREFDFSHFSRATPKFDPAELQHLNHRLMHQMPFAAVADRLADMDLQELDASFWETIRPNLETLKDAGLWFRICRRPLAPIVEDAGFLETAAELLPPEPWDEGTWKAWSDSVKGETGRKGKDLFMPLRRALTGLDHGPELKTLLPLIGRARALARLQGRTA